MELRKSLIAASLVTGISACSNSWINQAIAEPDRANRGAEINSKLDEYAAEHGITGKDLAILKIQTMSIVATKNRMSLDRLKKSCSGEIQQHCPNEVSRSATLTCIKDSRDLVSETCETALRKEFGGQPTIADQQHLGILIPKGSILSVRLPWKI